MSTFERPRHGTLPSNRCLTAACAGLLMLAASSAQAQQTGPGAPNPLQASPGAQPTVPVEPFEGTFPGSTTQGQTPGTEQQPPRKPGWYFSPVLRVLETATDNGGYGGTTTERKADLISDISAGFSIAGQTPRLQVRGDYTVQTLDYARGSQSNLVQPTGDLAARLEAIERHFFIDASVMSTRVLTNPFSPTPGTQSTLNNSTFNAERIVPDFRGQIGSTVHYRLRSDNGWTQTTPSNPSQPDAYLGNHSVDVEQTPSPFGLALNGQRHETHFRSASNEQLTDESARAILRARPWFDFTVGVRYGIESNNYGLTPDDRVGHFPGADLSWHPTVRTVVKGFIERRLFGHQWDVLAQHRMPVLAFSLTSSRNVTTAPNALLGLPAGTDIKSLLDAIYTTRYPDPIERAQIVNQVIAAEGLPTTVVGPVGIFTPNVTRIVDNRFSVVAKGRRNTVALALYTYRNEILEANVIPSPLPPAATDSYQTVGASASYSVRLTPDLTGSVFAASNRTTGIGLSEGNQTTENVYRLSLSEAISRHLDAVAGTEHRSTHSNYVISGEQTSVFAGLAWRP